MPRPTPTGREIYYCQAVEREIITTDPGVTPLVYPQAMLFQVLEEDGRLHHRESAGAIGLFGKGEAAAIALALEHSWAIMNEKTITKSIRLSPDESADLAKLSAQRLSSESALMRKWIQTGIQAEKIDLAIQAYM